MKKIISALLCTFSVLSVTLSSCTAVPSSGRATEAVTASDTTQTQQQTESPVTEDGTEEITQTDEEDTTAQDVIQEPELTNYDDMKAMWISQFDMSDVYRSGGKQRDEEDFTRLLRVMLDNVCKNNFNTVIFQVRPYADSMYPSELCPPCYLVTGSYASEHAYDPFEILIREAHERGLSVQAWINPMRAMLVKEIEQVSDKYRIKQWYNDEQTRKKYLPIVSDRVYLNIGEAEVRELIVQGAVELLERYDVDGLHMDDYFYPTTDTSFDLTTYNEFRRGGGTGNLASFRKKSLTSLISELYSAVKASNSKRIFGISPAGNMQTVINSHFADVKKWCGGEGYIDYICPQVYFGFEHASNAFDDTCQKWQSITTSASVKLIIGMSFGKAKSGVDQYAGSGKNEWSEHKDIMLRSLQYTEQLEKCSGIAVFCYQYFYNPVSGREEPATKQERDGFVSLLETISWQ